MTPIWHPGPANKQGYPSAASPPGGPKRGMVIHSAGGYWTGLKSVLANGASSWHFSVLLDGTLYQHYDLNAHCWHAADADPDDGVSANIELLGIECEGKLPAEPSLSPAQIDVLVELFQQFQHDLGWGSARLRDTLWEHSWVSDTPTSCPSGRVPWSDILQRINGSSPNEQELLWVYRVDWKLARLATSSDPNRYHEIRALAEWVLNQ